MAHQRKYQGDKTSKLIVAGALDQLTPSSDALISTVYSTRAQIVETEERKIVAAFSPRVVGMKSVLISQTSCDRDMKARRSEPQFDYAPAECGATWLG